MHSHSCNILLSSEVFLLFDNCMHCLLHYIVITMSMCSERHGLVAVDSAGSMELIGHGLSTRIWTIIQLTEVISFFVTCAE